MNNQPFNIGERVVCVETRDSGIVKDRVYPVRDVYQSRCCKVWYVNVGIKLPSPAPPVCVRCGSKINKPTDLSCWYHNAQYFRRLSDTRHSEAIVTATELLKIEEERGVDIVPQVVEGSIPKTNKTIKP